MRRDLFFVLGAQDPEMRGIEDVLNQAGIAFAHAAIDNRRCNAGNAYEANSTVLLGLNGIHRQVVKPASHRIVLVECRLKGQQDAILVDHHRPGDPGFEATPDRYMEGSSLGQVLSLLGIQANETQRMLSAADHCLTAAYQGRCPDIDVGELFFMRSSWLAKLSGRPLSDVMTDIERAASMVRSRFNPKRGEAVFLDPTRLPRLLPEGAAYAGKVIRYRAMNSEFRMKEMIKGANPTAIETFMREHELAGRTVYGNPHRGYAGAYL